MINWWNHGNSYIGLGLAKRVPLCLRGYGIEQNTSQRIYDLGATIFLTWLKVTVINMNTWGRSIEKNAQYILFVYVSEFILLKIELALLGNLE